MSALLLASVLESVMDAVITVNQQQKIVLFNRAAEKMFGWPRQEVMQQPLEKLIPARFRPGHGRRLEQFGVTGATARGMAKSGVMIYGLRANGQEFPIDVSISQVDTPEGKLFTAMVWDITGQQAARAQLKLLETGVSHLNDMVLITEAEPRSEPGPRIVFVNAAFERHTGYSCQEVMGRSPRFLQGPLTQRLELDRIGAALNAWQPVRAELVNYTKAGQAFWAEIDIVPIADARGSFTHWVSVQRDISERKLAEQALVDSEQRYAALFASAPVPMWVFDWASRKFLTVNQVAIEDYGYSAAEFLSMGMPEIHADAAHGFWPPDLAGDVQQRQGSCQHRRKDGSLFFADVVARPIQYAGRPACFVVALDMTAQARAEKEVQDYLFTLQRAADATQAITQHLTLEGMTQELAEQARGVIGAHQAAVTLTAHGDPAQGVHPLSLSLSGEYEPYRALTPLAHGPAIYANSGHGTRPARMTQAGLQAHPAWQAVGSPAGRDRMLRGWLAVPLTGRDGQQIGLLQLSDKYEGEFTQQDEYVATELAQLAFIAIENVSLLQEVNQLNVGLEKKVAERTLALVRQEDLFRALADQAPQVIWTLDQNGDVNYFNRAWFDLVGGSLRDWTGKQWLAAVHPEDLPGIKANWLLAQASQQPFSGLRRLLCKDGNVHTMAYRASPVRDEQGVTTFWVGIDADVTEIKRIEAALRLSNQELEAFSYSVSHDLRAPLNTINGFGSLLARQLGGDGNEKVRHYLARIQQGVAQMGQMIEDLLSLAQVARAQLRSVPVDLSGMARSILDEWQARQPQREVRVQIEHGLQVHGDERLLRVAMENLLGNAWKFSAQQAQACISVGHQFDVAGLPVFFVRDNGAGFDMVYAEKLFLPFERLHAVSEFAGTGVGLATVSRVIGRHGGKVWAEAAPGRGATFFFTLPRQTLVA
ncbi:MAG: PAS domain S-box protein [Burkholderiales bacterium]|nr:PAS domain S-box protein [Burkholderiales bacterium]